MSDPIVLTFNAGSSSLRCGVYRVEQGAPRPLWSLGIRGLPRAMVLRVEDHADGTSHETELEAPRSAPHDAAFEAMKDALDERIDMRRVAAVAHRVVHGGSGFDAPTVITPEVLERLDALTPLAPSHQPHNLRPIRDLSDSHPGLVQIACFDTAFHRHQPDAAQRFALPRDLTDSGILRFGFHGLSYQHIADTLAQDYPQLAKGRVIVAHLGHGVSLCAMEAGRSVATTMGLTALDGMPMGQRCGALDPGVVLHLIMDRGYSAQQVHDMLYQKSGLLGLSGISDEMNDLLDSDAPEAAEAVAFFVYRFRSEVGALGAALGGLDGLVLTGGMGEHIPALRAKLCKTVDWLGGRFDEQANDRGGPVISSANSAFEMLMLPTDEESVLARAAIDAM